MDKDSVKLFCLPYAGGSAVAYDQWNHFLSSSVILHPVELAGRGKRITEPLYKNVEDMIEDVWRVIKSELFETPYVLFGHSMGAMISYELAHRIRKEGVPGPIHIFLSGRRAPHIQGFKKKKYALMSTEEFKEEVIRLGGTPPELFDHTELTRVFLPLLRNDFCLAEAECPVREVPLDCNMTIFLGKDEELTAEQCDNWKRHTSGYCSVHYMNGGHFFIRHETQEIVSIINGVIDRHLRTENY